MNKVLAILALGFSTVALSGCYKEKGLNISSCFSLDFQRYKMGKFIFDTPPGLDVSPHFDDDGRRRQEMDNSFLHVRLLDGGSEEETKRYNAGKETVSDCNLKGTEPFDIKDKSSFYYVNDAKCQGLGCEENDAHDKLLVERKDKHFNYIWTAQFDIALHQRPDKPYIQGHVGDLKRNENYGVFKISEISKLRVVSDGLQDRLPFKSSLLDTVTRFEYDGREQYILCDIQSCSLLDVIDEDGLVYSVPPRRFTAKFPITQENIRNPNSYEILAPEKLPETVLPVLKLARSLRNRAAE